MKYMNAGSIRRWKNDIQQRELRAGAVPNISSRRTFNAVLHRLRGGFPNKSRDDLCCRCRQQIHVGETALGGIYNGVVCMYHRSCEKCWWGPSVGNEPNYLPSNFILDYGARQHEDEQSKNIALVNHPRKGMEGPQCFGCLHNDPYSIYAPPEPPPWEGAAGNDEDPIIVD